MRAIVRSRLVARQSKFRRYRKWNLIRRAMLERKKRRSRCTESIYDRVFFTYERETLLLGGKTINAETLTIVRTRASSNRRTRRYFGKRRTREPCVFLGRRVTSMEETKSPLRCSFRVDRTFFSSFFFFLHINYSLVAAPIGMINGYACSFHYPG